MPPTTSLDRYRLLGRSGLRVSRLALGTMTFGTESGWGADENESRRIFDTYVDLGGNFIDSANVYSEGTSERWIGTFAAGKRDRLVIATKYAIPTLASDPNSGGNHRKSLVQSVENSLQRLRSDYIDLLYLHAWDFTTPADQIMRAMDDLVRAGKVLYLGISNTPAWQVAKMQTVAEVRGLTPLAALQIEYNLIQRAGERELIPAAKDLGLGVIAYSPLAEGLLAGRYSEADLDVTEIPQDGTRKSSTLSLGVWRQRSLSIVNVVKKIAAELERPAAQVALAWALESPAITSVLVGARTGTQFRENLRALDIRFSAEHRSRLEDISAIEFGYPHDYLTWLLKSDYMGSAMSLDEVA